METKLVAQRLQLDRSSQKSLNRQLYEQLKAHILSGTLPPNSKLPPSRALAAALQLSRNTVVEAFDQLQAEGYTNTNRRGGTIIATTQSPAARDHQRIGKTEPRLSARGRLLTKRSASRRTISNRAFALGVPDLQNFPHALFARLIARAARHGTDQPTLREAMHGVSKLRYALADYLVEARGLHCHADQIIVVPGAQAGLDLMARLMIDEGDAVWVEDPCYQGSVTALTGAGAQLVPVPVDAEGMSLPEIGITPPRLIAVTPSHQFPLGVVTSLSRRLALLEMARRHNAFILEDDYDSEFRYDGQPIAAMQGLDEAGRVIYLGSFAKTMMPSLRTGYVILPPAFVEAARSAQLAVSASIPAVIQSAVADFITEGHFRAHVRRMRHLYEHRRTILTGELEKALPVSGFSIAGAGMQIVLHMPHEYPDTLVASRAAAAHFDAAPLSSLALQRRDLNGLLLGFGNVGDSELAPAARQISQIILSRRVASSAQTWTAQTGTKS